jgi:hypothetical protein
MGKLHEILAVEPDVKSSSEAVLNETINVFSKKAEHFQGLSRTYRPKNEDGEVFPPENKPLVTTVKKKLIHTETYVKRLIDLTYQKEAANQLAKHDLVINGITIARDVPATMLLNLESRLKHLKQMYLAIPTLEPDEKWSQDLQNVDTFISDDQVTTKTAKIPKPIVLYPATPEHPAQTQMIMIDETIGSWTVRKSSGKMSPAEKSRLLERIDVLITAVKKARSKANEVEVPNVQLADALFSFLNDGVAVESQPGS